MYLRIETKSGCQSFELMRVLTAFNDGNGYAKFYLDGAVEVLALVIDQESDLPDGAIGTLHGSDPESAEFVYCVQPMESLDDEIRSIMSALFETPPEQPQPTPELPLPMMMGFDDDGE